MELKVIEKSKNKAVFEIVGEDHTLCNALRAELNKDKNVKSSGYQVKHPLISNPKVVIETSASNTPGKAIASALDRMKKDFEKAQKDAKKF